MLDPSFVPEGETVRPPHDRLKLWLTAFGIVFGAFGLFVLPIWVFGPKLWALLDWLDDHHAGGLPSLILMAAIVLCWLAGSKLSAVVNRVSNRKKTGSRE